MSLKRQKNRKGEPKADEHHLLYPRSAWNSVGRYGNLVRNHSYYKKIIPIKKLHCEIHRQVSFIAPPSQKLCELIYNATERAIAEHAINAKCDTVEQRIDFFIKQLNFYAEEDYSKTISALQKQSEIVANYYRNSVDTQYQYRQTVSHDRIEKFSILFPAKVWGIKGYGKILSENSYFVVRIPRSLIDKIYRTIHKVAKPPGYILENVNRKLEHDRKARRINPKEDSLETRIIFLINAFYSEGENAKATTNDLKRILEIVKEHFRDY